MHRVAMRNHIGDGDGYGDGYGAGDGNGDGKYLPMHITPKLGHDLFGDVLLSMLDVQR